MSSPFLGPSWKSVGGYDRTSVGNYARFPYLVGYDTGSEVGATGPIGPTGPIGSTGPTGPTGTFGTLTQIASPINNTLSYNTSTNTVAYTIGTSISLFPDENARNSALTSPFLGQFCFITGTSKLQYFNNSGWITL